MKVSKGGRRVRVSADGSGVVSHSGVGLLRELAVQTGLVDAVDAALLDTYKAAPVAHMPGRVFCDVAVVIADGVDAITRIRVLRDRPELFGSVASIPTVWRLLERIDATHADRLAAARAQARQAAWAAGAAPDPASELVIDIDATITIAHSEKENAAKTWKKTFGFHPLLAFLDRPEISGGEGLAGLLRPGGAGSNTAADHIKVLDAALAGLPGPYRPAPSDDASAVPRRKVLVRTDAAGATHDFAATCRQRGVRFSLGFAVDERVRAAVETVPEGAWAAAIDDHTPDGIRDGAWVAEITGLLGLSGWPAGSRLIARIERPHPGAQLTVHNTTSGGLRITCFLTDTPDRDEPGQTGGLELRHRRHARVEDRIREAKATGLRNLPCHSFAANTAWLQALLTAIDLVCWTKLICFTDTDLARAEIHTFGYRVLHVAARITKGAGYINLKIDKTWRWATTVAAGWARLRAAFP